MISAIRWSICIPTNTETNNFIPSIYGDLSFASMKKANPSQHGKVLKLHVPLLWNIIPSFLQQLVRYCTSHLTLIWKERELINKPSWPIKSPPHRNGRNRRAFHHQTDQRYNLHPKLFLPGRKYWWWVC